MILADMFGDETDEELASQLEIDMFFDLQNLPLDNRTWDRLTQVILEVDELMEENNLDISKYSIILEEPREYGNIAGHSLGIYDFPKENLDSGDLPREMEDFFNNWNK